MKTNGFKYYDLVHPNSTLVRFFENNIDQMDISIYEPSRAMKCLTVDIEEAREKWYKLLDGGFEEPIDNRKSS